ncbi:type IV secretion system protein [Azospirillum picis]|uniref:Type IV secretion system protein VirB5 n=1 Tax=Azospirillum picis TaxID=488438 RepID=A0ABU0MU77_9PROT|nr:type IV secretion system protein [Azospirillum picis]MBP2300911.1 type IV secretion system protein VirB5 [Azospirillum picis]MDQ0537015.1 type IV secretion system protein VirB5 [Azospirillum picis]
MPRPVLPVLLALAGTVTPGTVRAQMTVIDPANLARSVEQVQQLTQQLQMMQQQYQQLQQTYQAIAHTPAAALNELGRSFNIDALRNALPAQSSELGAVMDGSALGPGAFGSAARGQLERNRVYSPDGADFQAQEMQRTATSVAGAQAMAGRLYQSAADRVTALQGLEGALASAADAKAVADLGARIGAEQAYIQAQQVQAQALLLWQQAQTRNQDQRVQERRRQSIDALIAETKARGG